MKTILQKNIPDHEATKKLARQLYDLFLVSEPNFCLFLEGGLGAGKTFLVREILLHFGLLENITSPTYTLVNEYSAGNRNLAHFDFYRLQKKNEFFHRGFTDIAEDDQTSCFVEWPEKISPEARISFSGKKYVIQITHGVGAGMRKIKLLEP